VGSPKWDVNILVVANGAGVREHADLQWLRRHSQNVLSDAGWGFVMDLEGLRKTAGGTVGNLPCGFKAPRRLLQAPGEAQRHQHSRPEWQENEATDYAPQEPLPKAYPAGGIYYTDGSSIAPPGTDKKVCGSGIYRAETHSHVDAGWRLDPGGVGDTNTIQRAELVPIHYVLAYLATPDENVTIATDSLCSLRVIHKALRRPHTLQHHKHRALAEAIAERLQERKQAGGHTALIKVKAHSGIQGNEQADKLAKTAAEYCAGLPTGLRTHDRTTLGAEPRRGCWWPQRRTATQDGTTVWHNVNNLTTDLKQACCASGELRLGHSNRESIYAKAWGKTADDGLPEANKMLNHPSGSNYPPWRAALKVRTGTMWTAKLAARYRVRGCDPLARCPACKAPDGITHRLMECDGSKEIRLKRHNDAVRAIATQILKGKKGNNWMLVDAGPSDEHPRLRGLPHRVPRWLLPDCGARPDILLVEGVPPTGPPNRGGLRDALQTLRAIHVIEVGYCMDTRWEEKLAEKNRQHDQVNGLIPALTEALATHLGEDEARRRVVMHSIPLGASGYALRRNRDVLEGLGLEKDAATKCLVKMGRQAMQAALHIMKLGRYWQTVTTDGNASTESRRA
jgi:ribonuclease HI